MAHTMEPTFCVPPHTLHIGYTGQRSSEIPSILMMLPDSFPDSSVGKESACNARDSGLIPGLGRSPGEGKGYPLQYSWVSLVASAGKESTCNARDPGSIPGSGRSPREGIAYPLQYSCLENPHGQRSLAGYSPGDHKESGKTEHSTYILYFYF